VQKAVAIIPARYDSTRFPGKPLATLHGKTIIQRVFEQVSASKLIDSAFIATDDKRIYDAANNFGGSVIMTSPDHVCGTDRIAEAARDIECDIIINVQGDEPFIRPEMIDDTVKMLRDDKKASMSTLAVKIKNREDMVSPHVVKVVMDSDGYALYFSRSPVPYYRDCWENLENISFDEKKNVMYKHIGIYGFRKDVLINFTTMEKSWLEGVEKLEQLRALASGIKIKVKETQYDTFGIDTIEDLRKAEEWQSISS
jgi:3-deoxy-manno-octulosonate cytidylyltransferase (CMP-KDO synthetase)